MNFRTKISTIFYKLLWFILIFFSAKINAQSSDKLTEAVFYLSNYLTSPSIEKLKNEKNDLEILDSLFIQAVKLYDNDFSEALLALTFTTLPYSKMPLSAPFFNTKFDLPLPSVSDSLFNLKNKNLPTGYILLSKESDIDKTTHFFGNAFLANSVSFLNLSEYLGKMVELFEYTFAIGGHLDQRDLLVNKLGALFGTALRLDNSLLPSQIFTLYNIFSLYTNPLPS